MARGSTILEFAKMANPFSRGGGDGGGGAASDLAEAPVRPQQERTAPRNPQFEELLCRAIGEHVLVELRYDREPRPRLFAPHAVYESTLGRLNVAGVQYDNPQQPGGDRNEHRIFQVGLIRTLRITDTYFRPDVRVDPDDPRYRNGIVCSV